MRWFADHLDVLVIALLALGVLVARLAIHYREREERRRAEDVAHEDAIRIARAIKSADKDGTEIREPGVRP